jgi:hypothetical protein
VTALAPPLDLGVVATAAALALVSLGGGFYECLVLDPAWPRHPALIQPHRGGVSRRRFWIPAHTAFELLLLLSLVLTWTEPSTRSRLLVAAASHTTMRVWSFLDFIPRALAFEQAAPETIAEVSARRWSRRSLGRLPLDVVTCGAMLGALVAVARLG